MGDDEESFFDSFGEFCSDSFFGYISPACQITRGVTQLGTDDEVDRDTNFLNSYNNIFKDSILRTIRNINNRRDTVSVDSFIDSVTEIFTTNNNVTEEDIITRFLADSNYTLESNESLRENYNNRRDKCIGYNCGPDCNNDEDCYWYIPLSINDSDNTQLCSCKPNIFIHNDEDIFSKKSLHKTLAEEFYNTYILELQEECSDNEWNDYFESNSDERTYCDKLVDSTIVSGYMFSSEMNKDLQDVYKKCMNLEGPLNSENRNNILKTCKHYPLEFCKIDEENENCINIDFGYYNLVSDIFSYYFLRNTPYSNPDMCECNLLFLKEAGCYGKRTQNGIDIYDNPLPEFNEDNCIGYDKKWFSEGYDLSSTDYRMRDECEDSNSEIPTGICSDNLSSVKSFLDSNSSVINSDNVNEIMTGILNKSNCKRTNPIVTQNNINYFYSRLYCDTELDKDIDLLDETNDMINKGFYERGTEYHLIMGQDSITKSDNNLKTWDNTTNTYTDNNDNNKENCTSDIHKCMGFEIGYDKSNDYYLKALESHYYLWPTNSSHKTHDIGYLRSYIGLNNYYLGDLSFSINSGDWIGKIVEFVYNGTKDLDTFPTLFEEYYELYKGGLNKDNFYFDEESGIDAAERLETHIMFTQKFNIDILNYVRDYLILFFIFVLLIIILIIYLPIIIFFHIPWTLFYVLILPYIKDFFGN